MNEANHRRLGRIFTVFVLVLVLVTAAGSLSVLWTGAGAETVRSGMAALPALVLALAASIRSVLLLRRPGAARVLGAAMLLAAIIITLAYQRHTDLGILVLGGDRYWVRKAAEAESSEPRLRALATALQGTQYALNTVENVVLKRYEGEVQSELFLALAELAPNEGWRERYRRRAAARNSESEEISSSSP